VKGNMIQVRVGGVSKGGAPLEDRWVLLVRLGKLTVKEGTRRKRLWMKWLKE
jgi:hypothetical protein